MSRCHDVGEYTISQKLFSEKLELMEFERKLHSRTRRSGFVGIQLHFETPDLPFEAGVAPRPLRPGELVLSDPLDDDGDDYPRE